MWLPRKLDSHTLSRRREVRAAPAATHRPWGMTEGLALPVWVLDLMWAQRRPSMRVVWEVWGGFSPIHSGFLTVSKIPLMHSINSQRKAWTGPSRSCKLLYYGGNWGQRNDFSTQVTKLVNNRTPKRTSCVKSESRALGTRRTSIWILTLHINISAILGTFLHLVKLEIMIVAYFEE